MRNIIRADLYRIFRSKGFYITIIIFLAYIIMLTASNGRGMEVVGVEANVQDTAYTGMTAPFEMMKLFSFALVYVILAFIIFIAAADFSAKSAKNVLSGGVTRTKYYFAKLILSCVFCVAVLMVSIIIPMIAGTVLNGFGGAFDMDFIVRLAKPFSAQLFMFLAINCVGIFFVFVTKRTAAAIGAYFAFCMITPAVIMLVSTLNDKLEFLFSYDVVGNISLFSQIDMMSSTDIIRAFAVGGFYIIASTIGGIAIFKRSEIK
jgi:ABC-2 type transport system permease protein